MVERPWDPPRYEHKSGMLIPRYANIGQDCGSAEHGTIRRHHIIDALAERNVEKAQRAVRIHMENAERTLLKVIETKEEQSAKDKKEGKA